MPKLFQPEYTKIVNGVPVKAKTAKWYVKMKVNGKWKPVPLSTNKKAAEIMYADKLRNAELGKVGAVNPHAGAAKVPLTKHVSEYADVLTGKGDCERHVKQTRNYLLKSFDAIGADMPGEVRGEALARHLAGRRKRKKPISPRRYNWEVGTFRSFFAWMVKAKRIGESPVADLSRISEKAGRVLVRRPMTEAECVRLIEAADRSTRKFRGLSGTMRGTLYTTAMATGFRCSELASLLAISFDFDSVPATATLAARNTKNRTEVLQPLPNFVVDRLRNFVGANKVPFPGTWHTRAAKMLRFDLEAAGIPAVVQSSTGPLTLDFHALRHTFVAGLKRAGVRLDDAMRLARHSDPKLTLAIYGTSSMEELGAAVNRLPLCHGLNQDETTPFGTTEQDCANLTKGPETASGDDSLELKRGTRKMKSKYEVKPVGIEPTTRRLKVCSPDAEFDCNSSELPDEQILALPLAFTSPDPRRAAILRIVADADDAALAVIYEAVVGSLAQSQLRKAG